MERIDTVVIGAGHAGLAISNRLTASDIDHVVLERDGVASRWAHERWDSFTLLTPNWATWLPGWHYRGDEPHGFMGRSEIVSYFKEYARSFASPVRTGVEVTSLAVAGEDGYRLSTDDGEIVARRVVIATGPMQKPRVPLWAADVSPDIAQVHSSAYRSPARLPEGGVLVVGSGPSGQQIAEDLLRAGRTVHLSVGRHRRVPRSYRGRDYYWWLELGGSYEKTAADVPVAGRRNGVAPALTGFDGGHDLDLRHLHADGVHLHGRVAGMSDHRAGFDDSLARNLADGDRAYDDFVAWVEGRLVRFEGLYGDAEPREHFPEPAAEPGDLDLRAAGVTSIVWATGFDLDFDRWVHAPVLDADGRPVHRRGVTQLPGLYFLGQTWLHRLRSPFIRGAEEDATHLATQFRS